jgi:hypothetical protein
VSGEWRKRLPASRMRHVLACPRSWCVRADKFAITYKKKKKKKKKRKKEKRKPNTEEEEVSN